MAAGMPMITPLTAPSIYCQRSDSINSSVTSLLRLSTMLTHTAPAIMPRRARFTKSSNRRFIASHPGIRGIYPSFQV